jgi:hypothetical protein
MGDLVPILLEVPIPSSKPLVERFCCDPRSTSEDIQLLAKTICRDSNVPLTTAPLLEAQIWQQLVDHQALVKKGLKLPGNFPLQPIR